MKYMLLVSNPRPVLKLHRCLWLPYAQPPAVDKPVEVVQQVEKGQVPATKPAKAEGTPVLAPMPGIILQYEVKIGDTVNIDDAVRYWKP